MSQSWEHFPHTEDVARHRGAADDERHGHDDQQHANGQTRREHLAKQQYGDGYGRNGLQCTHDGYRCGADARDGGASAEQRQGRGEQGHRQRREPQQRLGIKNGKGVNVEAEGKEEQAEEDDVERELQRRYLADAATVDPYQIDGIAQSREEDEQQTCRRQHYPTLAPVEQGYAGGGQQDAEDGDHRCPLMEEDGHNDGDQDGIDEEQRRGDGCSDVGIAHIERQRRGSHEQSKGYKWQQLGASQAESPTPRLHDECQHGQGEDVAQEEHAESIDAGIEQRQGKQRVGAVAGGGQCA